MAGEAVSRYVLLDSQIEGLGHSECLVSFAIGIRVAWTETWEEIKIRTGANDADGPE